MTAVSLPSALRPLGLEDAPNLALGHVVFQLISSAIAIESESARIWRARTVASA
jgi:hypothetical protein